MGRKTIPSYLKTVKGTSRADRENKHEPVVPLAIPSPPDHLSKNALIEWGRISNQLYQLGLLTEIDMASLAAYCQAFGRWAEAEEELNEKGLTVETTNGNIIQNPLVGIANQAMEHMRKHLTEFGMTPSSRAKVSGKKKENANDPFQEFGT